MKPLLFLRVGYMQRYDGPAEITSGGAFVREEGIGGEIYNFKPSRGRCYGYAMTNDFCGINLDSLTSGAPHEPGDELHGVDVIFIARRPGYGQVVVGWYRDATVFHRQYRVRHGRIPGVADGRLTYLCVADAGNAVLLPESSRDFRVPYAPAKAKGFPGRSEVWYPRKHLALETVRKFIADIRRYIGARGGIQIPTDERPPTRGARRSRRTDAAHNAAVEQAAVNCAWSHWERKGFSVHSVEPLNLGWDLVARRGRTERRIEVKGTSDDTINFQLTPNEYDMLRQNHANYRVCVVLSALDRPRLFELAPKRQRSGWILKSTDGPSVTVQLQERTAAVGVEVRT